MSGDFPGRSESASESRVRLWDGNLYERAFLERTWPGLAAQAEGTDKLEETMPHSAWWVALRQIMVLSAMFAGLFAFAAGAIWLAGKVPPDPLILLGGAATLLLSIICLKSAAMGFAFHWRRPTVSLSEGKVEVRTGSRRISARLDDCEWYVGPIWHMNLLQKILLPKGKAVILALPRGPQYTPLVAVGFSDRTRATWKALLTVSGVPQRTLPEKQGGWGNLLAAVAVATLLLIIYGPAFYLVGRCVAAGVLLVINDPDIGAILQGVTTFFGTLTAWAYTLRLWPSPGVVTLPTRRPTEQPVSVERNATAVITLFLGALVAMVFSILTRFNVPSRWLGAVVSILWIWIVTRDLARRELAVDHELTWPADQPESQES
jgi:hypothetical protein